MKLPPNRRTNPVSRLAARGLLTALATMSLGTRVMAAPPANDGFAEAILIETAGSFPGTTRDATREPDEPVHAGLVTGGSVWWRWIPSYSGVAEIGFDSSVPLAVVAVYRGSALTLLEPMAGRSMVGFRSATGESYRRLVFPTVAGVPLHVAIAGLPGVDGSFGFNLRPVPGAVPPNDLFADRMPLTGATNRLTGLALFASEEPEEPGLDQIRRTLWYEWTVPVDGRLRYEVPSGTVESLTFWRGDVLGALRPVARPWLQPLLVAGEKLVIAVNRNAGTPTPLPQPHQPQPVFNLGVWVDAQPVLVQPHPGMAVSAGAPLVMAAVASGAVPMTFQWFREDHPLTSATNLTLEIPSASIADAGVYRLVAINDVSSVTSSPVAVTVRLPDAAGINRLPARVTVREGDPLQVGPESVTGTPFPSLQWERQRVEGGWLPIPGATQSAMVWPAIPWEESGTYRLTVSNAVAIESAEVTVEVLAAQRPPQILGQPRFLHVLSGASVDVPILLPARTEAVFQWRTNGVPVPGQILPTVFLGLLPAGTELVLDAVVTNAAGSAVVDPIPVRVVGTNLFLETFPGGDRGGAWGGSAPIPMPRHGVAEMMLKVPDSTVALPGSTGSVAVGYDVWALGTWDGDHGEYGVDLLTVSVGGRELITASFSNNDGRVFDVYQSQYLFVQPYPGAPGQGAFDPRTGSLGPDPLLPSGFNRDTLYRFRHRLDALPDPSLLRFQTRGLTDESAAITRVYTTQLPTQLAWIEPVRPAYVVAENAGRVNVELRRAGNLDVPVEVRFQAVEQSAIAGRDFSLPPGSVWFAPGQTLASIPVDILDNSQPNRVRSLTLWLLDAGSTGLFSAHPAIGVSIWDDESRLRLTPLTNQLTEGGRALVGQLTREGDLSLGRPVRLEVVAGGRFPSFDLSGWRGGTNVFTNAVFLQFPAGQTQAQVPDSSRFPGFNPPVPEHLPSLNLQATQNTDPEAPNPYEVRWVEPADLRQQAAGSDVSFPFTVIDDDLTDAQRLVQWGVEPGSEPLRLTLRSRFQPRRVRLVAESSEDLESWVEVGLLDAAGRLDLPSTDVPLRFYRLKFLP